MRKSIFDIENRLDINKEFSRLIDALLDSGGIIYNGRYIDFYTYIDKYVFNLWDYRDTFISLDEYMEHIGVNKYQTTIDEVSFLNFLELLLNLFDTLKRKIGIGNVRFCSVKVQNIIEHNIPIILEKMNYHTIENNHKICIIKRDSDVDSILEVVPQDISLQLLSYNDIRNNNEEAKRAILKSIDLFLEMGSNKKEFKSYDSSLYDAIGTIVNKMGINHPINEEPYLSLSTKEIIEWYDKCFKMMIHLIRSKSINEIKKERNTLIKQSEVVK
ncbi:MAG: hypothetical protein ACI33S_02065 [Bacilli bacterium]